MKETTQRGRILQVLADNDALECAFHFGTLMRTLDNVLVCLSARQLAIHLEYLAAKGYVELRRRVDMPGYDRAKRGAGRPSDVIAVKLTPRGQDLVERTIPADPGVVVE